MLDILDFFKVRDLAVGFKGEKELGRRLIHPACQCFGLGKPVERHIDLDRVELSGIKVEPVFGRKIFGVEKAAPPRIAPTRRPDMKKHPDYLFKFLFEIVFGKIVIFICLEFMN